jgi:DNA-binding Xre family transcriptional regulator
MAETIKATEEALNYANQARIIKGWAKLSEQLKEASGVSISTLRRFWRPEAVKLDAARSICKALEIDFERILLQGRTDTLQFEGNPLNIAASFEKPGVITKLDEDTIKTYREKLYLYYFDEQNEEWFWRVVIVDFGIYSTPGKLITVVEFENKSKSLEKYVVEGIVVAGKLSIYIAPEATWTMEPTTEFVFPFSNTSVESLAGMGHVVTWDHKHVWVPCLLRSDLLSDLDREQEHIVDQRKKELIKLWFKKVSERSNDLKRYLFPNDNDFIRDMIKALESLQDKDVESH